MKKPKIILLISCLFLSISSCINTKTSDEESSNNNSSSSSTIKNNDETTDTKKEAIIESFKSNLNSNVTYSLSDSSYIGIKSNTKEKINVSLSGDLSFDEFTLKDYSFYCDYSYKNIDETIKISSTPNNLTSLKHNNEMFLYNQDNEINGVFNYLKEYKNMNTPTISLSNTSFETIFNEAFSLLSDSSYSYSSLDNSYIFTNDYYKIVISSDYLLKEVSTVSSIKDDYDLSLSFTNNVSTKEYVNTNKGNDLLTTLLSYTNNSSFKVLLNAKIDDTSSNNNLMFDGEINFDFTNSDIIDNNNVELSLTHYTNKNVSNDIYLRYQDTNVYFDVDELIKGRINQSSISSILQVLGLIDIDQTFLDLVTDPLNELLNDKNILSLTTTTSKSYNISSLGDLTKYIKKYDISHNVISLDIDTRLLSLPESVFHIEVGLSKSLKLKTLKIEDLKVSDTQALTCSLSFLDYKGLNHINVSDYPSYDFAPMMVAQFVDLMNNKEIGGDLSIQAYNSAYNQTVSLGTNIDVSASKVSDLTDVNSLTKVDAAISDVSLKNCNGKDSSSLKNTLNSLGIDQLTYQDKVSPSKTTRNSTINTMSTNSISTFSSKDALNGEKDKNIYVNANYGGTNGLDLYLSSSVNDLMSLATSFGVSSLSEDNSSTSEMVEIISSFTGLMEKINNNEKLKEDIDKITNEYSLTGLNSFISIKNNDGKLDLRLDPEYLFGYEMGSYNNKTPDISLSYDINEKQIGGISVNMTTSNASETNKTSFSLAYNYEKYETTPYENVTKVVNGINPKTDEPIETENGESPYIDAGDLCSVVSGNTKTNIDLTNYTYGLKGDIKDSNDTTKIKTSFNGKIGVSTSINNSYYTSGDITILDETKERNKNDYRVRFVLDKLKADLSGNLPCNNIRYVNGKAVYTCDSDNDYLGIDKYLNGSLTANVDIMSLNNTPLKVYGGTSTSNGVMSSLESILNQIKDLSDSDNIVYRALSKYIDKLNSSFTNMLIYQLIANKQYLDLLDSDYIKINSIKDSSSIVYLNVEISDALLSDKNDKLSDHKWIKVDLEINKNKTSDSEGNNIITYSLDHLTLSYDVYNLTLELETLNNNPYTYSYDEKGNVNGVTADSILDDTGFTYYSNSNKNEFVDINDIDTLLELGINTTNLHYFELEGVLNISKLYALNETIGDVGDAINDKYVNAKIRLDDPDLNSLTLKTSAHITIRDNDNTSLSNNQYVEYFTERIKIDSNGKEQEICYIVNTSYRSYISSSEVKNYDYNNITYSFNQLSGNYKNETVVSNGSNSIEKQTKYEERTVKKWNAFNNWETKWSSSYDFTDINDIKENKINEYMNYGISRNEAESHIHINYKSSRQDSWDYNWVPAGDKKRNTYETYTISWDALYKSTPYTITIIPAYNSYTVNVMKVTQDELLETTNGVPNLLYYLVDYALFNDDFSKLNFKKYEIMGIIYYQVANGTSENSKTTDYIGMISSMDRDYTNRNFSILLDLSKIMSGLGKVKATIYWDNNNMLKSLYVDGNEILTNFYTITAKFTLNIKLVDSSIKAYSGDGKMDRYDTIVPYLDNMNLNYANVSFNQFGVKLLGVTITQGYKPSVTNAYSYTAYTGGDYSNYKLLKGLVY